jgi:2-methylcitrate dehydratase PrpD
MPETHIDRFANFVCTADTLPSEVAAETKRIVLDSIGCALAATEQDAGRAGIAYGRILGGPDGEATIIGTGHRTSAPGAAFANAELVQALDFDAVASPGHVAPYVVPVALALGEASGSSGVRVMSAVAVCHEMSFRLSRAMDRNRDVKDGKANTSPVLGYSGVVFGVTAAAARMKQMGVSGVADALGIAGSTSPVNGHRAWLMHVPTTTIKNSLMPGGVVLTGITAAHMADFGHRGDRQLLDDATFGYPRYIGTRRWEPAELTTELGTDWRFLAESYFKPYPHCRVSHALFDALIELVRVNDIKPDEIVALHAWGEAWVEQFPTFLNQEIERPFDAQFSFTHGLALAAHLVPPGKEWQDPDVVFSSSVMDLMSRVVWQPHPDWAAGVAADPTARPSRIEIVARGTTFVGERSWPKGSPSPDPSTYMTTDELVAKFLHNATGIISAGDAEWVVDRVLHLEEVDNMTTLMRRLGVHGTPG